MTTTTKTASKKTKPVRKQNDPKFRVIPNLSLKGKDIMARLRNGSLRLDATGQYSLSPEIDATRRMTKLDIELAARENFKKIQSHQKSLKDEQQRQRQAARLDERSGSSGQSNGGNKEG